MPTTSKKPRTSRKFLWLGLLAIFLLLLVGVGIKMTLLKTSKETPSTTSAGQDTKGEPARGNSAESGQSTSKSSDTTQPGDQKSDSGGTSSLTLLTPTGNFVSNHHPGEGDSQTSVCTTTPGASCKITFTKDGVTKSLDTQVTDRGGSAYWNNWKLSNTNIGLTSGNWQVQAVATLNGQTKSATDATELVVQ